MLSKHPKNVMHFWGFLSEIDETLKMTIMITQQKYLKI